MPKIDEKCDGCGTCVSICPKAAIFMPKIAEIDKKLCVNCMLCIKVCPIGAILERGIYA